MRVFCVCVGRVCERFGGCPPPAIYLGTIVVHLSSAPMARGPVYVAVLTGFLGAQWQRASAELPCVGQWLGRCAGVSHRVCLQPDANQHAQPRATALGFSRTSGAATSAHSLAGRPRGRAAAKWSGLLECPCGTRMIKTFDHRLACARATRHLATHASAIPDAAECFAAGALGCRT